jgi:hypothetical protein
MGLEPILLKAMRVCAFLLILSATVGSAASAQSLADVARRESERRETVKAAGKTYTNTDLKQVPAPAADATAEPGASAPGAEPGQAEPAAAEKTEQADESAATKAAESDETKDEAYWSRRMTELREQLERDETFADALQNRIDALTIDFVNRDDPAQRSQIASDRQKALAELERVKKSIEQDKRAIPDLEEEARRAGVPAGWLRQ